MKNDLAFGYIRVSSIAQIGGSSISTQKDSIVLYSKLMQLKLTTIYCDAGVSGVLPLSKRPQGSLLFEELKKRTANLVVFSADRLFRSEVVSRELPSTLLHFTHPTLCALEGKEDMLFKAAQVAMQNLEFIFRSEFGTNFETTMNTMLNSAAFFYSLIDNIKSNGCQVNINEVVSLIRKAA